MRSGYTTRRHVAAAAARASAPPTTSRALKADAGTAAPARASSFQRGQPARRLRRARPQARRDPRAPADPPPQGVRRGRRASGRGLLRCFADLRTGDIVVHEDHGIARFAGFDTKTVAGVTRDYLNLEYQGTDKVFLPVDQLAKISRYVGADGRARRSPSSAARAGRRSRRAPAAPRRSSPASCSTSTPSASAAAATRSRPTPTGCASFEEAFPYRETPDQREAIEPVKADMESERPMDRLICGDVGYGKTEVALRAAFKAANDGKQVLMLVPTTILAQQHYGTFSERLRDYPFTIEHVSRFRPPAEQREAVKRFAEGKVDILIGTHRAALARRAREGPRPAHRRRGAALRRQAEGAAAPAQAQGRRDLDERDADPAHAADEPRRPARHLA